MVRHKHLFCKKIEFMIWKHLGMKTQYVMKHPDYIQARVSNFSTMASTPIITHWIKTNFQSLWKIIHSIVLQTIFHEYKIKIIKLKPVFLALAFGHEGEN